MREGFALFMYRWEGGGINTGRAVFAEKSFEFWNPTWFRMLSVLARSMALFSMYLFAKGSELW